ncbi:MAG TPA: HAMP domain-containing histidine kinase [Chloroflexi bacterium]|nr:HAMP domain-containing histidine kinase [Chloroflexota bacterium]
MKKHSPIQHQSPWKEYKDWKKSGQAPPWQGGFEHFSKAHIDQRRKMGWRFAGVLLFLGIPILILGVVLGLVIGGNQELLGSKDLRRLMFCSIPFLVPIIGMLIGSLGIRRWVNPLADVMSAAESLSEGDFSVRVVEKGDREFLKLAQSFNHMAEELEHAQLQRRNMTADVAHELRTPLHILQGNLEGALDGVYEASPDYFRSMLEETRLLQRLVEDLQTLSMAESGTLDFHFQKLSVTELLEDVITSFSGRAEEAGIQLLKEVPDDKEGMTVEGDWHRLDQVIGNLVANALRYTPEGGQIRLDAIREGDSILVAIQDSGEGIPEEDLPFVFDRFWKGDKSRSRASGGSGLGLAIARQLVTAHGGAISVESQEGEGTTFTVRLPAE